MTTEFVRRRRVKYGSLQKSITLKAGRNADVEDEKTL